MADKKTLVELSKHHILWKGNLVHNWMLCVQKRRIRSKGGL
jgi:hypothetical protein